MKPYRIKPGAKVRLADFDPEGESEYVGDKERGLRELELLRQDIIQLQRIFYAEHQKKLLVILQAMDTGGKDGTVRHVFAGIDPHGFRVIPFKAPTAREREFDFLWRIHQQVPGAGEIVVFNRSHYEDIVAVKVKNLAPKAVWEKRFDHIVNFERLLSDEGTTILKFYLHISQDEQKRRLTERIENPRKHWKLDPADIADRERWPQFIAAYEEVLGRTSTEFAPWYVVPANKKWYRNLIVARIVRDTLARLEPSFPAPKHDFNGLVIK